MRLLSKTKWFEKLPYGIWLPSKVADDELKHLRNGKENFIILEYETQSWILVMQFSYKHQLFIKTLMGKSVKTKEKRSGRKSNRKGGVSLIRIVYIFDAMPIDFDSCRDFLNMWFFLYNVFSWPSPANNFGFFLLQRPQNISTNSANDRRWIIEYSIKG